MGNKSSTAAPAVVKPAGGVSAVAAPMDAVTQCRVKGVELNQLQNDVHKKQAEIDSCNPEEANQRRILAKIQEYSTFTEQKGAQVRELRASIQSKVDGLNALYVAAKPALAYSKKLKKEADDLDKAKTEYEQQERTQRRNFLDNDPQDGVSGILGVRTSDDKVLLAFWITYGVALAVIVAAVLQTYGAGMATRQKVQTGAIVLIVMYGIAYYGITVYG
jgi:hypothetical protein